MSERELETVPGDWTGRRVGWFNDQYEVYGRVLADDDGLIHVLWDDGSDGWWTSGDLFFHDQP